MNAVKTCEKKTQYFVNKIKNFGIKNPKFTNSAETSGIVNTNELEIGE